MKYILLMTKMNGVDDLQKGGTQELVVLVEKTLLDDRRVKVTARAQVEDDIDKGVVIDDIVECDDVWMDSDLGMEGELF